jgi:hypothetical protein
VVPFGADSRIGGINAVAEVSANAPCCFPEVRAFFGHAREDTEKRGGARPLFSFRGFAHDPQRVLTVVHQFALVGSEHLRDFRISVIPRELSGLELSVASFAHADDRGRRLSYDPQFALRHVQSLAHRDEPKPVEVKLHHYQDSTGSRVILATRRLNLKKESEPRVRFGGVHGLLQLAGDGERASVAAGALSASLLGCPAVCVAAGKAGGCV